MKKRLAGYLLMLALLCTLPMSASAKTISSARADNVFFYAADAAGKSVLLKVLPLSELEKLSHGRADGRNYEISSTDNYPTTQYCEARGFTVGELVDYVKSVTTVTGAAVLSFSGGDTLRLMATDSYGNYSRSWTYDQLYGVKRYYFEGLYNPSQGWNTGWEIAGEDSSKHGVTLDEYNASYKNSDPYYAEKRAVFAGGVETVPVLATQSYSGRTTSAALTASTEPGIASYLEKNGGKAAGCLKNVLTDAYALRLSLPMTEADLMAAHRTAYDNFKWIYNLRLDMERAPAISSRGTVANPIPTYALSGNTLTVSLACATAGVSIYYGDDGATQTLYTGPITVDVTGRNLSVNPVTTYVTAVREGYDDAGVLTFRYPGTAPAFETVYSGMTGSDLTFKAAAGVSAGDWSAWTGALSFVTVKTPSAGGYVRLEKEKYRVNNAAETITFDKAEFPGPGSYSLIFHAAKYADKAVSVTMKKTAPALHAAASVPFGAPVTLTFDDAAYLSGLSVYVTPKGGSRVLIPSGYLDRTQNGRITVKASYFTAPSGAMSAKGDYTLEMVNNRFYPVSQTVDVTLTDGFTDVAADAWYADAVAYVTEKGLFSGSGGGQFSPDAAMTRAMFVTVLWRMADQPAAEKSGDFTDVAGDDWCAGAVSWASANGIVGGFPDGKFYPGRSVTREQIAAILYRYAKMQSGDATISGSLDGFTDADGVSEWARQPLAWAVGRQLVNGYADGRVNPQGTATRAQVAQILTNYAKAEGESEK